MRRATSMLVALMLLGACSAVPATTPDPRAIPSGSPVAHGPEAATGPILELGTGRSEGIGWRLLAYQAADEWCTQLETGLVTSASCGDPAPPDDSAFAIADSFAVGSAGLVGVEGIVSSETATVWIVDAETSGRVPAQVWSLEDVGVDGKAFAGVAPAEMTVTHLLAVAFNGRVLETYELP